MTSINRVDYAGWSDCIKLTNGQVEVVVLTAVGPRIIHYSLLDRHNLMHVIPATQGQTGGDTWHSYGGHRLWHAPEDLPRSYYPDSDPVQVEITGGVVKLTPGPELGVGIQKEMEIWLPDNRTGPIVRHRLRNIGSWPIEIAPWAVTVLRPGGTAIVPQSQQCHPDRLLPNRTIALWPYTNMRDPRITWGERLIMLRQDPKASGPTKIGMSVTDGWAAYLSANELFVKRIQTVPGATYPDWGSSVETYTNPELLELETLGPLAALQPGEACEHVEEWELYGEVPECESEADYEREITARLQSTR